MKPMKTLFRASLIFTIIACDLYYLISYLQVRHMTLGTVLFLLSPAILQITLLLFPNIPFAPYIAAFTGFWIGIEATGTLVDYTGESTAVMVAMSLISFFVFPPTSYLWVDELRRRKITSGKSDPTRFFSRRTKASIPPEAEGKILKICGAFLFVLFFLHLSVSWMKDLFESGDFSAGEIVGALSPMIFVFGFLFMMWEEFRGVRDAFRKSRSFADGIDPATMELAAYDYDNAERCLDGRILLGDKYIFGSRTAVFLEYDKLSKIIVTATPYSTTVGPDGPISIEMAECIVDVYARQKADHQLIAETTDGRMFVLCHLPATNEFQSYEKYWKKELRPVLGRICEKSPSCVFLPEIGS